ncbi:MAG TPA: hypothetical protein VK679_06675, partial [Gemmatimonadaceae bacterium]|nr:hypothetical protein [Gemmatimonadaceae bacterium]
MTRIGFTYNQKPEPEAMLVAGDDDEARPDEEPPSRPTGVDDQYAEWDDEETIDAVEHALSALGEVV